MCALCICRPLDGTPLGLVVLWQSNWALLLVILDGLLQHAFIAVCSNVVT